jgi:hypothetical protein
MTVWPMEGIRMSYDDQIDNCDENDEWKTYNWRDSITRFLLSFLSNNFSYPHEAALAKDFEFLRKQSGSYSYSSALKNL